MHALSPVNTPIQNALHLCVEFSEGQNSVKSKSDSTEALKGIFQLDIFMLTINFLTPCWFGCCAVQKEIANTHAEVGMLSTCFFVKKWLNHFYLVGEKKAPKKQTILLHLQVRDQTWEISA